jgi:hypothetical protein
MGSRGLWTIGALAIFVVAAAGQVKAPVKAKPVRVASTPEEAVRFVAEARKADDMAGVLAQVAEPNRSALEWRERAAQAYDAFQAALTKKFGAPPFGQFDLSKLGSSMTWSRSLVVVKKKAAEDGQVGLTVWETNKVFKGVMEMKWTAVKAGKGWKLLLPVNLRPAGEPVRKKRTDGKEVEVIEMVSEDAISPRMPAFVKEAMPKYLSLMQQMTKEVEDGKYKTRQEAEQASRKAGDAFFKKHPEPETKKSAK